MNSRHFQLSIHGHLLHDADGDLQDMPNVLIRDYNEVIGAVH